MTDIRTPSCDSLQPRLAAYALGEVQSDPELAGHLSSCASCSRDLQQYLQVARVLPYTAPQVVPPPELRGRILAAATGKAAVSQTTKSGPLAGGMTRRRQPRRAWLAFGAACIALLGLLGWNVRLQSQLNVRDTQLARSRDSWQTMTALLNDPSVQSFALAGDAATGRFWVTSSGDVGCLVVQGLPELAAGQVYQVWLREGDQPVGVATFVTQAGNAWTLIRAEQPIQQFQAIGITIEPQGGSPAPTGQGVLFGELSPSVHGTPQVIAAR